MMVEKRGSASFSEEEQDMTINTNGKRLASPQEPETKKKFKTKSLYRQPTVRELTRLNEAEILFNSNLFRLQIEEILQEVKLKEKTQKKFDEWFANFKKYLNDISISDSEYDLLENTLYKELNVKSPLPKILGSTKCMFKFHKFENIKLVGSYALGCSINSKVTVDIEIKVPADVYTKNDSINYKYHKKRGAYLACIASHLKSYDAIEELKYFWPNGSFHSPILEGKPTGKLGNHVAFRIHLSCGEEAYKLQRFFPSRNNLRESWLFNSEAKENELGPPTPYYNCSVLCELTANANFNLLERVFLNQDNLKNAVLLIKVWLRQRGLKVSGYVVNMFVAYLVQLKRVNNMMSSYQIVRNVWVALKSSNWDTEGISIHKSKESPQITDFLNHFPVVFLDVTGYYNIAYQMSKGTYEALKRESALAVQMLDNGSINSFIPLFMKTVQDLEQFDHILRFKNSEDFIEKAYNSTAKDKQINYGIDKLPLAIETANSVLNEGLGDRVFLILEKVEADFSCSVKKKLDKALIKSGYEVKVLFGFVLNPESAMNIVLKGPPANLPEAEVFRSFWGDKSELRRFQDGSIKETCVWEADSVSQKRTITRQIVHYLLDYKFGIKPEETFYIADQLDSVLIRKQVLPSDGIIGTGEEHALKVVQAFDELRRDLRGLTELPLDISSVNGTSPVLSYTDPFPVIGQTKIFNPWQRGNASLIKEIVKDGSLICPNYTPVYEAVVELTHSGKWPGNLEAFRCLKAAFYIQISDRIAKQYALLTHPYQSYLDVVKNGVVFRLRIAHSKELTLLRRQLEAGVVKHRETEESIAFYRDFFLLPKIRGALHGLQQKHPAYGPTTCLAKRFLAAHMIDDYHFSQTSLELLAAYVFIHPEPYTAPVQPLCGFVRLMRLIAETDWTTDMLLIDFNGDLKPEEKAEIERKFSETPIRERAPLYIMTSYDIDNVSIRSAPSPTARVLVTLRRLAAFTVEALQEHLCHNFTDNVLGTFIPQQSGYDVTIRLRPHCIPYVRERVSAAPTLRVDNVNTDVSTVIPVVDFQPARTYLDELRNAYGEYAVFFYDTYGGEVIGVLWKPDVDESRDFQIATASATMPINNGNETKYIINKAAIIEDFKILGEGFIKEVIVHS